jgi:redox-sensitive bicupin YhaK (pirin superfamily)
MSLQIIPKEKQGRGAFNGGEIIENKPIGFPRDGGLIKPYSNLFYWAYAEAKTDSTIGLHPHEGFEIMSFVLKGQIKHYDTQMDAWKALRAGDAQIIRSGSGISHAEHMEEGSAMFQIWLDPDLTQSTVKPASYDDYKMSDLPVTEEGSAQVRTYIGKASPFELDTYGIGIQRLTFKTGTLEREISTEKIYSLYALYGHFTVNGQEVNDDDFIVIQDETELKIEAHRAGEIFWLESPERPPYPTYMEMMRSRVRAN